MKKWILIFISLLVGVILWFTPQPQGVTSQAWHLFAIFVGTVVGIVARPIPTGAIALIGLLAIQLTETLSFVDTFSGYTSDVVWLVIFAFFIARGFIITGLGARIAYIFMKLLGKKTLGLSYGLALTELCLAPAVPSVTARGGGIIYPILRALSEAFGSSPADGTATKMGTFLTLTAYQITCVTSAMFVTAMAGNPLSVELAGASNVTITWGSWALAAAVPGVLSLILVPFLIYKLSPPVVKETANAKSFAVQQLQQMGKIKSKEWIMIVAFFILLFLWIFSAEVHIKPAITALLGICLLIVSGVLSWKDVLKEESAWDTLIWFPTLIMMAGFLSKLGLTTWFSNWIVGNIQGYSWQAAFAILGLLYFYSHYFFASTVAHIGAMYSAFLVVSIALGTPPMFAALTLAFFSNLFGGLTHYGSGPAPIFYGSGYVQVANWWRLGFFVSILNIIIWVGIGGLWWKMLGIW